MPVKIIYFLFAFLQLLHGGKVFGATASTHKATAVFAHTQTDSFRPSSEHSAPHNFLFEEETVDTEQELAAIKSYPFPQFISKPGFSPVAEKLLAFVSPNEKLGAMPLFMLHCNLRV